MVATQLFGVQVFADQVYPAPQAPPTVVSVLLRETTPREQANPWRYVVVPLVIAMTESAVVVVPWLKAGTE